ncbi:MAG: DUF4398 domain-containing protein [Polyangiaceae bacterium]|nr:DUF4398 domain-containing protein [Polyangiaceae bacterium]
MRSSPLHAHGPRLRSRVASLGLLVALPGCGNAVYAIAATSASRNLEQAREVGAESLAPYEFYYAEEHLEKAQSEAAEADYGDARILAHESKTYAKKAIEVAHTSRRGAEP